MYKKKLGVDIRSPLEYGMSMLSGKWKSRIVCLLGKAGQMRYGELKDELINISDGVLSSTLNELIGLEMIMKSHEADNSSMTEYVLTEKGASLIPIIEALCRWAGTYYKESSNTVMRHCLHCKYYRERKIM